MTDERGSRWGRHGDAPAGHEYDARWQRMAAAGKPVHGEADLVASFAPATVLDAGCGTGRVAIELAARGIEVVGVDLDPAMLGHARAKAPDLEWVAADLASVDLGRRFDAVVMAGNVMIFVAPRTEQAVVANMGAHVAAGGVLIAGFQLDGGLAVEDYDAAASAAGLVEIERWATWEREPWTPAARYAVVVHRADAAG